LNATIKKYLESKENHLIVLITFRDLLRAKHNPVYGGYLRKASLILPKSPGIAKAARFLRKEVPSVYLPYEFTINTLNQVEENRKSVYFIGAKPAIMQNAFLNLKSSFTGLNIVGRFNGFFPADQEESIKTAVQKATPSLIVCGTGLPGEYKWLMSGLRDFPSRIIIDGEECMEIFSGKKSRPTIQSQTGKRRYLLSFFRKPVRIFNGFLYAFYGIILLINRIRRV
jgi:N-acetylglucosaminyldiphosphoundecaprenol N-acetyl-beta-D-mannosaminyltransferase